MSKGARRRNRKSIPRNFKPNKKRRNSIRNKIVKDRAQRENQRRKAKGEACRKHKKMEIKRKDFKLFWETYMNWFQTTGATGTTRGLAPNWGHFPNLMLEALKSWRKTNNPDVISSILKNYSIYDAWAKLRDYPVEGKNTIFEDPRAAEILLLTWYDITKIWENILVKGSYTVYALTDKKDYDANGNHPIYAIEATLGKEIEQGLNIRTYMWREKLDDFEIIELTTIKGEKAIPFKMEDIKQKEKAVWMSA